MELLKIFCIFSIIYAQVESSSKLETVYEWKYLNVTPIPPQYGIDGYFENGSYFLKINNEKVEIFNHTIATPVDVDKSKDGRTFVSIGAKDNVFISLTTISNKLADNGPLLIPYPDYSWFLDRSNCSKIINARSITIDTCNRLWILDSGKTTRGRASIKYCKAKLLVFDLSTNTHLNTYEIPDNVSSNLVGRGAVTNPVIRTSESNCDNVTAFITDSEGYALIIWDGKRFVRLLNPVFKKANYTKFTISNESFPLPAGILPMDSSPSTERLYFAAMSSKNILLLQTIELKNSVAPGSEIQNLTSVVYGLYDKLRTQPTTFRLANSTNTLFIGQTDNSIDCWSEKKLMSPDNFDTVITDNERLQYIISLKVRPLSSINPEEQLWVLTNRLQKMINKTINFNDINFRIMRGNVIDLTRDTKCA